jgi:hypothetical protein
MCLIVRHATLNNNMFCSVSRSQTVRRNATHILADACHGVGFSLAQALHAQPGSRLACATQSEACATEFRQSFWDGDRLITSTLDLSREGEVENFVENVRFSFGDDVSCLIANVGCAPSRWHRESSLGIPRIVDTQGSEWIRLSKDVSAVGILLKSAIPMLSTVKSSSSERKVICIVSHLTTEPLLQNAALKASSAALGSLVTSTSEEMRSLSPGRFCCVKIDPPFELFGKTHLLADWSEAAVKLIDRLRFDDSFARECDGMSVRVDYVAKGTHES